MRLLKLSTLSRVLISISSFFHTSAVWTRELKELALDQNLAYLHLPSVFEVRWTEFSLALLHAVLV